MREQAGGFADNIDSVNVGLLNHSQHIELMRDGLMSHKTKLIATADPADLAGIMQELSVMKQRVDSLDRAGRLGAERSGADLVDLMQRRVR